MATQPLGHQGDRLGSSSDTSGRPRASALARRGDLSRAIGKNSANPAVFPGGTALAMEAGMRASLVVVSILLVFPACSKVPSAAPRHSLIPAEGELTTPSIEREPSVAEPPPAPALDAPPAPPAPSVALEAPRAPTRSPTRAPNPHRKAKAERVPAPAVDMLAPLPVLTAPSERQMICTPGEGCGAVQAPVTWGGVDTR